MEPTDLRQSSDTLEHQQTRGVPSFHIFKGVLALVVICLLAVAVSIFFAHRAPLDAHYPLIVEIPIGYSVRGVADLLEKEKVIRSAELFVLRVALSGKEGNIAAGSYLFDHPESLTNIVERLTTGQHGIATHRVTFPEGTTVRGMGLILKQEIPDFPDTQFIHDAESFEGRLFPDTYFFYSTATSGEVIMALRNNFEQKTALLRASSTAKGLNWDEVVILASIVEKEAATAVDRRIIAGILQERIRKGMRLQVDAPFLYTLGKTSAELTVTDLASDSPYNTYRHSGLPPTPIGNPGADAIAAVITPTRTPYLYYLSGNDGTMYYARTFDEHKRNKNIYLK